MAFPGNIGLVAGFSGLFCGCSELICCISCGNVGSITKLHGSFAEFQGSSFELYTLLRNASVLG